MDVFDTKNSKLAKDFQLARKLAFGLSLFGNNGNKRSCSSQIINANRVQIHAPAYNPFNWFRRLVSPEHMKKDRIDTVRLKLKNREVLCGVSPSGGQWVAAHAAQLSSYLRTRS